MNVNRVEVDAPGTSRNVNVAGTTSTGRSYHSLSLDSRRSFEASNAGVAECVETSQNQFQTDEFRQSFQAVVEFLDNIYDNCAQELKECFDIPKLWRKYQELDWKMQALIAACIIAVVGLLGYGTWKLVCYLYPRILAFLSSQKGQQLVTDFRWVLNDMRYLGNTFGLLLAGVAQNTVITEVDDVDLTNTAESLQQRVSGQPESAGAVSRFVHGFLTNYSQLLGE